MQRPEMEIEKMLSRLMPVAISEQGQDAMDGMLDDLCGGEGDGESSVHAGEPPRRKHFGRISPWKFALPPVGIAAATAFAFFKSVPHADHRTEVGLAGAEAASWVPDMVLLGESDRVESLEDGGWLADAQGRAMQAVRVRVVEENTFRDQETGIVVHVSEPREELILTPINAF